MTGELPPPGHVPGRAVSVATYRRYNCRCAGCVAARLDYVRDYKARTRGDVRRRGRIIARAQRLGATWLRRNHPDQWARLVAAATVEQDRLDAERRRGGAA